MGLQTPVDGIARMCAATVSAAFFAQGPAAAQPASVEPPTEQPDPAAAEERPSGDEIIVRGRRTTERYRIPPELRSQPTRSDHRVRAFDPQMACHGVGPVGCGMKPLHIITVGADGEVRVGAELQE